MASRRRGKWNVAIHEAGHAIATLILTPTTQLEGISIREDGDSEGRADSEYPLSLSPTRSEIERTVVVLFAGFAAEVELARTPVRGAASASSDDDNVAREFLALLPKERVIEGRLRKRARSFVRQHRRKIRILAGFAMQFVQLDGSAIELIWKAVKKDEPAARRRLAEYLVLQGFGTAPVLIPRLLSISSRRTRKSSAKPKRRVDRSTLLVRESARRKRQAPGSG